MPHGAGALMLAWTSAALTVILLALLFVATHPTGALLRCRDAFETVRQVEQARAVR